MIISKTHTEINNIYFFGHHWNATEFVKKHIFNLMPPILAPFIKNKNTAHEKIFRAKIRMTTIVRVYAAWYAAYTTAVWYLIMINYGRNDVAADNENDTKVKATNIKCGEKWKVSISFRLHVNWTLSLSNHFKCWWNCIVAVRVMACDGGWEIVNFFALVIYDYVSYVQYCICTDDYHCFSDNPIPFVNCRL